MVFVIGRCVKKDAVVRHFTIDYNFIVMKHLTSAPPHRIEVNRKKGEARLIYEKGRSLEAACIKIGEESLAQISVKLFRQREREARERRKKRMELQNAYKLKNLKR